ncbi:3D domain-containing protein [Marinoscillum furvescens]|nr:3D domain-containing protein [Marinoscillum furvescens]
MKLFVLLALALSAFPLTEDTVTLQVQASAYNSIPAQTRPGTGNIGAWGDTLKPGMKVIAVSRDLIAKGLTHNTAVKIHGLEGTYLVKDKMNQRWTNKIDIYMGTDVQKALQWGIQEVQISFEPSGL